MIGLWRVLRGVKILPPHDVGDVDKTDHSLPSNSHRASCTSEHAEQEVRVEFAPRFNAVQRAARVSAPARLSGEIIMPCMRTFSFFCAKTLRVEAVLKGELALSAPLFSHGYKDGAVATLSTATAAGDSRAGESEHAGKKKKMSERNSCFAEPADSSRYRRGERTVPICRLCVGRVRGLAVNSPGCWHETNIQGCARRI